MTKSVAEIFGNKPPKAFKSRQNPDKCSNDDLLVGIELEIENLPNGRDWYQEKAGSFWSVIEDGSLRPRGEAWEFVSKPASLGTALAEMRIFFEKFGFTADNYSDRCSVHVHTNVQDFSQEQVANLMLVYPVFEPVLFQYVNHYKKVEEQGYCRDTNLYCIPWSACRMNKQVVERFFSSPEIFLSSRVTGRHPKWEKYTALNLVPIGEQGTVEWRHMHGTADMDKIGTWVNIIGSMMKFCKDNDFNDIVKTLKVLNDVSTYQQFFTAVLGTTLQYKEEYRAAMAEGVVDAKFSLINWEANKDKPKGVLPTKKLSAFDELLAERQRETEQGQRMAGNLNMVDFDDHEWERLMNTTAAPAPADTPQPAPADAFARFRAQRANPVPGAWARTINHVYGDPNPAPAPVGHQAQLDAAIERLRGRTIARPTPPVRGRR